MRRFFGFAFGLSAQLAFLLTLLPLYQFLHNDFASAEPGSLWIDALLAIQFVIPHSVLLHPQVKTRIVRWVPGELYGCLFCLATCAGLWLQFLFWRGSAAIAWEWPRWAYGTVWGGFFASWIGLLYSFSLTGFGYQTGLTPWWCWVRGVRPPQRTFQPIGAYRYLRHPAYLSFLGLVWFTPIVTADRAVLIAVWSLYVFVGSFLKDRRLSSQIGERYRQYRTAVPAYVVLPVRRSRRRLAAKTTA